MNLRYNDESFSEWASDVQKFETERARRKIANGENIDAVIDDMTRRIAAKLMHPFMKVVRESAHIERDAEAEKAAYFAKINQNPRPADQVTDE